MNYFGPPHLYYSYFVWLRIHETVHKTQKDSYSECFHFGIQSKRKDHSCAVQAINWNDPVPSL